MMRIIILMNITQERTKRHRSRKNDPKFKGMSTLEAAKWGRKNLKPSGHTDGKSMDFATSDPEAARQAMMDNGFKKVKSGGHIYYKKGNITVIDEYAWQNVRRLRRSLPLGS